MHSRSSTRSLSMASSFPRHPWTNDIEKIFSSESPSSLPLEFPFTKEDLSREDESDDSLFYTGPRFVQHIDAGAIYALKLYYNEVFNKFVDFKTSSKEGIDCLDLCSSWVSHYPEEVPYGRVHGVGLNELELQRNGLLDGDFSVQDLNKSPSLSHLSSDSFDVVTITVSIDYLTQPIPLLQECLRVLRDGGCIIISFSNRMFPTKAIKYWREGTNADRVFYTGICLNVAAINGSRFTEIEAFDLSPHLKTDPLFVVSAVKRST
jgi:SAM-dependent methyltransferase